MHPARRVAARAVIAIVILAMTAACQTTQGSDKTGGDTVVLTLATFEEEPNANGQNHGPEAFVENLGKVSQGRLKVELKTEYGDGAADAESQVVRAIASGEVDGGWPSTRAFARGGVPGLEVVEAPLTISSYAAEKALVSGPVAAKLLARLNGSGVAGLGLTVGPLRRPFAANAPLLGPEDWKGITFRVFNSPVQADAVRALEATPADLSLSFIDQIKDGTLRAAEFDIAQYEHNALTAEAGNVTANVVLWPKVFVLALSQKRFDALTPQQQAWVREAAAQAVKASIDATYDETRLARALCDKGARFYDATPDQLQGLRARLRPVLDKLATDPTSAQLLRDIQAIAAQHPGPEAPDVPASCAQGVADNGSLGPVPTAISTMPDGVYRSQITQAEVTSGSFDQPGLSGIWTLRVQQGTYQLSCRGLTNNDDDCGDEAVEQTVEAGNLRGKEDTVYFVYNPELLSRLTGCSLPPSSSISGRCWDGFSYRMTWTSVGKTLRFSDYRGAQTDQQYLVKPWQKIA